MNTATLFFRHRLLLLDITNCHRQKKHTSWPLGAGLSFGISFPNQAWNMDGALISSVDLVARVFNWASHRVQQCGGLWLLFNTELMNDVLQLLRLGKDNKGP